MEGPITVRHPAPSSTVALSALPVRLTLAYARFWRAVAPAAPR